MDDIGEMILESAEQAVEMGESLDTRGLDYSEASLGVLENILAQAADWGLLPDQLEALVQPFGCYILEVGRCEVGGRYLWHTDRDAPVLVVGEPGFRVAILTWDKVRGRIGGDAADNIPFFYAGFAGAVRKAIPGQDVLYA